MENGEQASCFFRQCLRAFRRNTPVIYFHFKCPIAHGRKVNLVPLENKPFPILRFRLHLPTLVTEPSRQIIAKTQDLLVFVAASASALPLAGGRAKLPVKTGR